jgi:hypothetical protein
MDFDSREVKFGVKDKSQFNATAIVEALKGQGFPNSKVKTPPS